MIRHRTPAVESPGSNPCTNLIEDLTQPHAISIAVEKGKVTTPVGNRTPVPQLP